MGPDPELGAPSFPHTLCYLISHIFQDSLKASPVVLFTSHIAQRRCAVRSFLSHPFRIKLMRANHDSSTLQRRLPSKPPYSPALLLTYRLRHPPSTCHPRPMAVRSRPYRATQSNAVLPPGDTSRPIVSLLRTNDSISLVDISHLSHHLGHTCTPPEQRIGGSRMSSSAGLSKASTFQSTPAQLLAADLTM